MRLVLYMVHAARFSSLRFGAKSPKASGEVFGGPRSSRVSRRRGAGARAMPPSMSFSPGYRSPAMQLVTTAVAEPPDFAFLLEVGGFGCCGIRKRPKPIETTPLRLAARVQIPQNVAFKDRSRAERLAILKRGLARFVKRDPRQLVCDFLGPGDSRGPLGYLRAKGLARHSRLEDPDDSHWFGVFRPTGREALYMMMTGRAKGKALTIKGKSARKGLLAGFVPFLQISEEAHKRRVMTVTAAQRCRVFYRNQVLMISEL